MKRLACPAAVAGLALALPLFAAADEVDVRLKGAAAFQEGKTADTRFYNGLEGFSADQRKDFVSRMTYSPAPVRALFLYELARVGHPGADDDLDKLLSQRSVTGRIRLHDASGIRDAALYWRGDPPRLRNLAAGLMLASEDISEETGSLGKFVRAVNARDDETDVSIPERRDAVVRIGWLHLRRTRTGASQAALEKALRYKNSSDVRQYAAAFVGVTGDPDGARKLVDCLRVEDDPTALDRVEWALSGTTDFAPEARWPLVPEILKVTEDFNVPDMNRQRAVAALRAITGVDGAEAQRAWWTEKQKELAGKPKAKDPAEAPKSDPPPGAAPPPPPPDKPSRPPAPPVASAERDCAKWLMLARNFVTQKNYDKAEENVKKVLEKCPEGKHAEEAKELQKRIELLKGL